MDIGNDRSPDRGHILFPSSVARRLRGGLFPGHHLLSDALVPGSIPRAGHQFVHAGDPDFVDRGIADLRAVARHNRLGTGRLAMALHSGGVAVGSGWNWRLGLSDRFAAPGALAATRRDRLA